MQNIILFYVRNDCKIKHSAYKAIIIKYKLVWNKLKKLT